MRVRFKRAFRDFKAGETFDAQAEAAERWIKDGIAEPVEPRRGSKAIDAPPRDKAIRRGGASRKQGS